MENNTTCPKCGSPLGEVVTTKTGKKLQRCSTGSWNSETRQTEGCDFVKWLPFEPETTDEKCPKCGEPVVITMTRFNKKMKKCSTSKWDPKTKTASGCNYFEWMKAPVEELDEECPQCGAKLIKTQTATGKNMKKCSTGGWDKETRSATGCTYVEWLR
jgi:ssDNA-binding Zn-finger/Zn-ribbon topoisomerase 1